MQALHALQRGRRRAKDTDRILAHTIEKVADGSRFVSRALFVTVCYHDPGECRKRWIEHRSPIARLPRVELFKFLRARQLKSVVVRKEALDDDFAWAIATAGTSGDLRE